MNGNFLWPRVWHFFPFLWTCRLLLISSTSSSSFIDTPLRHNDLSVFIDIYLFKEDSTVQYILWFSEEIPTSKRKKKRWPRYSGHGWVIKDELMSNVLKWPQYMDLQVLAYQKKKYTSALCKYWMPPTGTSKLLLGRHGLWERFDGIHSVNTR